MAACLRTLVSFFTVYPAGGGLDFGCVGLLPYVAAPLAAAPAALALWAGLDPWLSYAILLLATGLNHLDGLADTADALMVRDRERARAVLEDPRKGTAGIFAVVAAYGLAAGHLAGPLQLLAAEAFSKAVTVAAAAFSRPFKPGLGQEFIVGARRTWPLALPALAAAAAYDPRAAAALAASLLLYAAAYRHLGGANGDLFGFLLEVSRVAYLAATG